MNKKSVVSVMVVAMLLTVSLYFVGGTYARYIDKLEGTASADVAKWVVKVNETAVSAESKTIPMTFTVDENDYVTEGKIAPASSLSSTVTLDLTGTEVAVDVFGSIDTSSLAETIGTSKITAKITVDGNELNANAQAEPTFTVANVSGSHTVKVTIEWDNDNDGHNDDDTKLGRAGTKLEDIPVTLTVQQHIKSA